MELLIIRCFGENRNRKRGTYKLRTNLLLLIGNLSNAFINFLIIFTLARFDTILNLGIYTYIFAILAPIFIFANMKLRNVITTDITNENSDNDYFNYRIFTILFTIILSMGILLLIDVKYFEFGVLIITFKTLETLSDSNYGYFQRGRKFITIAYFLIFKNTIATIVFIWSYFIFHEFFVSMMLIIIVYMVSYLIETSVLNFNFRFKINIINFRKIFILTYSLGISGAIAALVLNLPRYILEINYSEFEVGIFSVLSYFLVVFNIYISSLGQILLPKLNRFYFKRDFKTFNTILFKTSLKAALYGILLYILVNSFTKEIIQLTIGQKYVAYEKVLELLVFGAIFLYVTVYFGTAFNAMRKFNVQMYLNLISVIFTLIISLSFIPKYGVIGAAYTTMITNIITAILYVIFYLIIIRRELNAESK